MTPLNLNRLAHKWQKRLGLLDWKITASFVPGSELESGSTANVWWMPEEMTAGFYVQNLEEAQPENPKYYVESCVLHELLHVLYYGHAPVPDYDVNTERAIHKTQMALLPERKRRPVK